ncbi:hypothetical protein CBD41_01510 [bacterium TMED181]|nr:MAG: hypothetical protein CBD41_01510 [bacterium TMED181]
MMFPKTNTDESTGFLANSVTTSRIFILALAFGLFSAFAWITEIPSPLAANRVLEAQSGPKWKEQVAGVIPTEFGELLTVNGTAGNYSLVFRDNDKILRIVDLRGGKIPNRSLVIQRK